MLSARPSPRANANGGEAYGVKQKTDRTKKTTLEKLPVKDDIIVVHAPAPLTSKIHDLKKNFSLSPGETWPPVMAAPQRTKRGKMEESENQVIAQKADARLTILIL